MKAIVWTKYGSPDGLRLADIPEPMPKDHEVRIRIHATTVTAGDWEVRSLKLPLMIRIPIRLWFGIRNPRAKILGQELAGEVESVGKAVTRFKVGDRVFGTPGLMFGAYAEYICLSEKALLLPIPANLTYEEAAAVPVGALEAYHFLRQANIQAGQKVLVYAAGGSIGTYAVQLAKTYGAEVTAVDAGAKLDMLRGLGADHVVDYTREDFAKSGQLYDVVYDVIGKSSFAGSIRSLKANGRYLLGNAGLSQTLRGAWLSRTTTLKVITGTATQATDDLLFLKGLIEAGKLKPVIDRSYPLAQMAEAHRYAESGAKKGNIVITV